MENNKCNECWKWALTDAIPKWDYVYLWVFIESRKIDISNMKSAVWEARIERIKSFIRVNLLWCDR